MTIKTRRNYQIQMLEGGEPRMVTVRVLRRCTSERLRDDEWFHVREESSICLPVSGFRFVAHASSLVAID